VRNGSLNRIEKLALLDLVMAAQASGFCFSFYKALDPSRKIKKGIA